MKRLLSIIYFVAAVCTGVVASDFHDVVINNNSETAAVEVAPDSESTVSVNISEADMTSMDDRFSRNTFTFGQFSLPYRQTDICMNETVKPILVLYLHGGSSRGSDNEAQLNEAAVSVVYNYLSSRNISATMIVPQCPADGGWTSQNRKVVNELMKKYASDGIHDADRVYIMGGSMGGTGTWCQLGSFPNFYAAAMPVAGNPTGQDAVNVATTPVRTVMGTEDNLMSIPAVEQFQAEVLAAGGTLLLDIEPGWSHPATCEQSYTDERLDWLFAHVKGIPMGISKIDKESDDNSVIYDLSGRRVISPTKGIYIQNGKKYVR